MEYAVRDGPPKPAGAHGTDLSVVICTRNRAASLERTLASLARADRPDASSWEVLVVDNGSTDPTPAVISTWTDRLPLRYLFEPTPGLSAARNRAMTEARGGLLIFTDDDVEVDRGWLTALADARRRQPTAGYLAGRILPVYDDPVPSWWTDGCERLLAGVVVRFAPRRAEGLLTPEDPRPMGANLAIDAAALRTVGGFRTDLGRRGACLIGGEEVAVLIAMERAGLRGVYVPAAVVYHHTPVGRLSDLSLLRYFMGVGAAAVRMGHFPAANRFGPPRWIAPKLVRTGLAYLRHRPTGPAETWIEPMRTFGFYLGAGLERLRSALHPAASQTPTPRSAIPSSGATQAGDESAFPRGLNAAAPA